MLSLWLTLGLVGALALLGCGPRAPDEFDDAVKVCAAFQSKPRHDLRYTRVHVS